MKYSFRLFALVLIALVTFSPKIIPQWNRMGISLNDNLIYSLMHDGTYIYAGTQTGIYRSNDEGKSWPSFYKTSDPVNALFKIGSNILAGVFESGIFLYTNDNNKWTNKYYLPCPYGFCFIESNSIIYVGQSGRVSFSTDFGNQWSLSNSTGFPGGVVQDLAISGAHLFAAIINSGVYLSSYNGSNWGNWNTVNAGLRTFDVRALEIIGSNLFAGTNEGGVLLLTDNASSWKDVSDGLTNKKILCLLANGTQLYAGTDGSGVFVTNDNGSSWTALNTGLSDGKISALVINNQTLYAANNLDKYVYKMDISALSVELTNFTAKINKTGNIQLNWTTATEIDNYGFDIERKLIKSGNWNKIGFVQGSGNSNSTKNYSFTDKDTSDAGYSYRLKQIDNSGKYKYTNEVAVVINSPSRFLLGQNFPNPFNPTTTIKYSIPASGYVSLKVYDIIGNEVAKLVDETKPAGNYQIDFDASMLNSGIYFYKMQSGNFMDTKKLILLK